jgi:hypothetical protein
MPVVGRFFGIVIAFCWEEHLPPHFHAKYSGDEVMVEIRNGTVLRGSLPSRALSLVQEWRNLHVEELIVDWEHVPSVSRCPNIAPLE